MIKITTDRHEREKIERALDRENERRWNMERFDSIERRMYELERRLDNLNPPVAVNREEKVIMPANR